MAGRYREIFFSGNNHELSHVYDCYQKRRQGAVAQWLARCAGDPINEATVGSTSGRDRVKDRFSVRPSRHLCRFGSVCLAFVCIAQSKKVANVNDLTYHLHTFPSEKA